MDKCAKCGAQTVPGGAFCGNCGEPLTWRVGESQIARVYDVKDVPGWLTKPLTIEPNHKALVFIQGKFEGSIPSGTIDMGGLVSRITSLGRTKVMRAVVINEGAITLQVGVKKVRTADGFFPDVTCEVRVRVDNAMVFLRNAIADKREYTQVALRQQLFTPLRQATKTALARVTLDDVRGRTAGAAAVEQDLAGTLSRNIAHLGLAVVAVSIATVGHEGFDQIDKDREDHAVEQIARDDQLDAEDVDYAQDLRAATQEIRRGEAKADNWEKRIETRERMRRIALTDRMAAKAAAEDESDFLAEVRKAQLVRDDEVAAVERAIDEQNVDHDLDRDHALDLLAVRQARELLDATHGLDMQRIEAETDKLRANLEKQGILQKGRQELQLRDVNQQLLVRSRQVEAQIDDDRKRYEARLEREHREHMQGLDHQLSQANNDAEIARIEHEIDRLEMEWLMELKERKDRHGLQMRQAEISMQQDALDRDLDRELRQADAEHQHKTELMQLMSGMPLEQLVTVVDDNERARILADLRKQQITAEMTEEQIMAVNAAESPAVAEAIKARFMAEADTKSAQELQKMAERMLQMQQQQSTEMKELMADNADRASADAGRAIDAVRDVGVSAAGGGGTTVVLPNGQTVGGAAAPAQKSEPARVMVCPTCQTEAEVGAKHCANCGHQFYD